MVSIFNRYVSAKALFLAATEALLVILSFACSVELYFARASMHLDVAKAWPDLSLQALGLLVLIQGSFYYSNAYDLGAHRFRIVDLRRLAASLAAACVVFWALDALIPGVTIQNGIFLMTLLLSAISGAAVRLVLDKAWPATVHAQNILILGTGELASAVAQELAHRKDLDARFAGFVSTSSPESLQSSLPTRYRVIGSSQDLISIVEKKGVSRIIVAMEEWRGALPTKELMDLRVSGVVVEDAHTTLAGLTGRVWLHAMRPNWLTLFIFSGGFRRSRIIAAVKRASDLFFGLLALTIASPLMLLVAIAILIESGRPIIYRQVRVGYRGKQFELLKFRSMRVDAEADGQAQWAAADDPRVTWVGRYLRHFRLDELPQFFNVIRGEMSFVGPRPERPYFVEKLQQMLVYFDLRHTVRPGITGWAQVRYRYCASIEDSLRKLEYDLFYLKNMSFFFDCSIMLETLRIVLFGFGSR